MYPSILLPAIVHVANSRSIVSVLVVNITRL